MAKIEITLVKSVSGRPEDQERVVRSLGLRKLHQTVVKDDNPRIRGMVDKVPHLLRVKNVEGA